MPSQHFNPIGLCLFLSMRIATSTEISQAIEFLTSKGFRVCHFGPTPSYKGSSACEDSRRFLTPDADDLVNDFDNEPWWINLLGAMLCVTMAALAAGLTLGLLGLDPLMLLIKQRASESQTERDIAQSLLPVVKQHHRLLVTLLLMNSIANEALPIFLEAVVPPSVAILMSVTLVLFFGEIIPSAVFTGPNKLALANRLLPLVRTAMFLLYPLAGPIAALLDYMLHCEEDVAAYNRGELSALVRIHYEERLAAKRNQRHQRDRSLLNGDHLGALDFTSSVRRADHRLEVRATMNQIERNEDISVKSGQDHGRHRTVHSYEKLHFEFSNSIHKDEVLMVEGALQMKTKVVLDVLTPMRRVFTVADDTELTSKNLVKIYASGFTRIPVYKRGNKLGIIGVLMTRHLIVVEPNDHRLVRTLPLRIPFCVSPALPLVNILNYFQTGGGTMKGGHMALVCAVPQVGNKALSLGEPIPETAGLMGIVTLEDVLEMLLQEEIYDEMDREKRAGTILATKVAKKWRKYVARKCKGKLRNNYGASEEGGIDQIGFTDGGANETTSLL